RGCGTRQRALAAPAARLRNPHQIRQCMRKRTSLSTPADGVYGALNAHRIGSRRLWNGGRSVHGIDPPGAVRAAAYILRRRDRALVDDLLGFQAGRPALRRTIRRSTGDARPPQFARPRFPAACAALATSKRTAFRWLTAPLLRRGPSSRR